MNAGQTQQLLINERLGKLIAVVEHNLGYLSVEELLQELITRAREILGTDTAAVLLLERSTQQLVATAASGLEEEVRQRVRIPLGHGFAGRIAAERSPVVIEKVDSTKVMNPILLQAGVKSLLGVPLVASGELLGVLHVGTLTERHFTDEDVQLLQVVADRVALATQARLSAVDRQAAAALQRSLLPEAFPAMAGLRFAGRYVPSERGGFGGDWYDVFRLPDGRPAIAIGDAMGHGLRAAIVMSRLRSTLRAYALETNDPADVLVRVDRKLRHFEPDELATVMYGVFDPTLDRLEIASAGHPPPVLATADGRSRLVDHLPSGPPLGIESSVARGRVTVELPQGAVLLFYTDGLVERRDRSIDRQLRRLVDTVSAGPPDVVCAAVTRQLLDSPPADDLAVLCVQRVTDEP
jgi:sigma-B regulation protein RsbU (phosphoserine phosphatase)